MKHSKTLLWINAILFVLFGAGFMFTPTPLAEWITGSVPGTPSGMIDLRATYGGLALGIGLYWAVCASNGSQRTGLFSAFLVLTSIAFGRVIGMVVDGSPNIFMFILLTAEVVFAAMNFVLYKQKEAAND